MKSKEWSFIEHENRIKIEGFEINKLINKFIIKKVRIKNIEIISDTELDMTIMAEDLETARSVAGNAYRITVTGDMGYKPALRRLSKKKASIVGIALFFALIYIQSLFVHEVQIYGYESITENQLITALKEAGIAEGMRKPKDHKEVEEVELSLFQKFDNITYAHIDFEGCLAKVTIVESEAGNRTNKAGNRTNKAGNRTNKYEKGQQRRQEQQNLQEYSGGNDAEGKENCDLNDKTIKTPCNIVADKEGYVYEIIPTNGIRAAEDGQYVKKGDVLISGVVPLQSTAYGTEAENITERYTDARGTVRIRVPYRFLCYTEKSRIIKTPTGEKQYGIELTVNGRTYKSSRLFSGYEAAKYSKKTLMDNFGRWGFGLAVSKAEEVRLSTAVPTEAELEKFGEQQIRLFAKENLPKSAEIINKSLNFTQKENIIIVGVSLETIEETGVEQEIVIDENTDGE